MDKIFYVYALLNPLKPGKFEYGKITFDYKPFYIGKGKGNRYHHHLMPCAINIFDKNRYKINTIKHIRSFGVEPIVIRLFDNLSENSSFNREIFLIKLIGRENLTNMTDGGEGCSGRKWTKKQMDLRLGVKRSKEFCEKLRRANLGKKHSLETRLKLSVARKKRVTKKETLIKMSASRMGHIVTDETRKKISLSHIGIPMSNESKVKMSLAKIGKSSPMLGKHHTDESKQKIRLGKLGSIILSKRKPIYQFSVMGDFIKEWDCIMDARKIYGIGVQDCVMGKSKTAKNYIWVYKNDCCVGY